MINNLFNPKQFQDPISIEGQDIKILKKMLHLMILIIYFKIEF
jgi:hypothetical protein